VFDLDCQARSKHSGLQVPIVKIFQKFESKWTRNRHNSSGFRKIYFKNLDTIKFRFINEYGEVELDENFFLFAIKMHHKNKKNDLT